MLKKVKLCSPELIAEFVGICSSYGCDINIYIENSIIDAKSIIGVFGIAYGREIEVQPMTDDKSVISSFVEDMGKFEV